MLNDDLDAKLELYEGVLCQIKRYETVARQKRYTGLFDILPDADGKGFGFRRNEDKIRTARRRFGYFVIFTTDTTATAKSIIRCYRDKDYDEKLFYDLKQYMGARRPRVHRQGTFDGKYSILMLALILRTWMKRKLHKYKTAHHLTLKRCIMKLSDIKMFIDDDEIRLLKSMTAEQRDLLGACSVDYESLEETVRQAILVQHKLNNYHN